MSAAGQPERVHEVPSRRSWISVRAELSRKRLIAMWIAGEPPPAKRGGRAVFPPPVEA
jgi:hypothetical protein